MDEFNYENLFLIVCFYFGAWTVFGYIHDHWGGYPPWFEEKKKDKKDE